MRTQREVFSRRNAMGAIAIVLFLVFAITVPALSRPTLLGLLAATSTPTTPPGDVIPLKSIAGLTSLNANVQINANGLIGGKRTQGGLNAELTTNSQGKSKITITGPLLGQIAAQVGGTLVGMFTPSSVDIYKVPEGTYIVVNSLIPLCIKPATSDATAALDEMSPQSLLSMVTSSDVARGKLVDQLTVNGTAVKHYVINGKTFLAAAQKSSDPKLKAFGDALWNAKDADLYVDAAGGYPLAFNGSYSGTYEPLKFEGDFDVQIELTGVNKNTPVNLPASCNKPITP
jgi:hypothetical protein